MAGAGLGLTIAREIVQRAGGDIKISNRESRGLQQIVELSKADVSALATGSGS
jgi:K+-sensing histidine kinase KdpD